MTRIVVAAKTDKTLLQDTQSNNVILTQPSIIQVGVTKDDVSSLVREGNNLVIHLKNGENLVIENFFIENATSENSLTFPEKDGTFVLSNFDEQGKFTNYSGLEKLESLLFPEALTTNANGVSAYDSNAAGSSDFSFSNMFTSDLVKAGLSIAGAVGLGLVLFDSKSSSSSSSADTTAPTKPTAKLSDDGLTITGTGEANSIIKVVDNDEKLLVSVTVDASGNYSIKLSEPLVDGNIVYLNSTDAAGNASSYTSVTGTKDTIAPDEPQAQLSDDGKIVTGKTEANATVKVYDDANQLIGTAKANANGGFSVALSPAVGAGKVATVVAEDAAGNKSDAHKVEIGKDTIAPDQPKLEVSKDGATIKGTAEANTKIEVQNAEEKVIGTATTDANGKFTITLSPALGESETGQIVVQDQAGNKSESLGITIGYDTLAPDKATATLNADGTVVTGTAEANATVTVHDASNNVLGSATVDAEGKYSVTLSTALTESKVGNVYVQDAAKNSSVVTTVTGTKDVTAPNKPVISDITDDVGEVKGSIASGGKTDDTLPTLSGTGEAGATLTIYDNAKPIGVVTVLDTGKWSFTPETALGNGSHSLTAMQTDKAGNTSLLSDAYTITVEAPTVKAASEESEQAPTAESVVASDASTVTDSTNQSDLITNTDEHTNAVSARSSFSNDYLNDSITGYSLESILADSNLDGIDGYSDLEIAQDVPSISELLAQNSPTDYSIDQAILDASSNSAMSAADLSQSVEMSSNLAIDQNTSSADYLTHMVASNTQDDLFNLLNTNYSII